MKKEATSLSCDVNDDLLFLLHIRLSLKMYYKKVGEDTFSEMEVCASSFTCFYEQQQQQQRFGYTECESNLWANNPYADYEDGLKEIYEQGKKIQASFSKWENTSDDLKLACERFLT